MTTETWIYRKLEPMVGATWLLTGWRHRWLRSWVRLICNHRNTMTWKINMEADCYNRHGDKIGHVNSLILMGCSRCNKIFRVYDYRA